MKATKSRTEHEQRTMKALATIHKGDKVKIVNCFEAEKNEGVIFEVLTEPYEICGTWCVMIEQKGAFDIACLQKIN